MSRILRKSSWAGVATAAIALIAAAGSPGVVAADQSGSSCPALPYVEGGEIFAHFAGSHRAKRVLPYGRRSIIAGRLVDSEGFGLPGETLCVEERARIPSWPYNVVGSTTTRADGSWSFKLPSGPSRSIRVDYGGDPELTSVFLNLNVHARATLHLRNHRTRPHRAVSFFGRIPGPLPAKRVVILRGAVPGAKRKHLFKRAKTDAFGHFRIDYRFGSGMAPGRFVFWVVVPAQDGYPYKLGRSPKRFVRVHH